MFPSWLAQDFTGLQRRVNGLGHMSLGAVAEVSNTLPCSWWRHDALVVGRDALCAKYIGTSMGGWLYMVWYAA